MALIEAHVFAAERLHGDDTIVPLLAKGKTITARLWDYVRDDDLFGGNRSAGGGLLFFARPTQASIRKPIWRNYSGLFQADAFSGYKELYKPKIASRRDH